MAGHGRSGDGGLGEQVESRLDWSWFRRRNVGVGAAGSRFSYISAAPWFSFVGSSTNFSVSLVESGTRSCTMQTRGQGLLILD